MNGFPSIRVDHGLLRIYIVVASLIHLHEGFWRKHSYYLSCGRKSSKNDTYLRYYKDMKSMVTVTVTLVPVTLKIYTSIISY